MLCFCSNPQKLVSQFFFKISRPQTISSAKLFKNLLFKAQHAFSGLTGGTKWRLDSIYDYYQQLALLKKWSYICRITISLSNFLFLRVVELYNYLTIEKGQEIIKNGWAGIRGHTGSVRSVAGSRYNEGQQYFSADSEYTECVFARNGLEEEEEGIADEICYIVSVDEGDQD